MSVAALSLVAAACSSGTPSSSGTSGTGTTTPAVDLTALAKVVEEASAEPTFATYAPGYGGKVTNVAALKGKKLMIIPGNSALAACTEIAQADAALARAVGMVPTIFQNTGTTTEHNTAIQNAIHLGYAAIDLECAYDPSTSAPAIAQAKARGLVVVAYGSTPEENAKSKVDAATVDTYALDAKVAVDQAVVQHKGKPFSALAITSNQAPATPIMQAALKAELKRTCPACTLTSINVEVPSWQTSIASSLASALIKNPKVTVLFPHYAGMLTYVMAGIASAHRTSTIKSYLAFGGGTPFIQLQTQEPGKSIIQSDIGGYPVWTGYLLFLQTARVLQHMTPIPYAKAIGPNRVATPENAAEILRTGGWGTDFVNGFRNLLGLPSLQGQALFNAATLNGIMTAKV